jgi:hypothetical protein
MLLQSGADTGVVITRALEGTMLERMNREDLDTDKYVQTLLEGTMLSQIMSRADSLSSPQFAAQAVRRGNLRETAAAGLYAAQKTAREMNEEIRVAAARIAAYHASRMLAEAKEAYMDRVEAENAGMRSWQERFARESGYRNVSFYNNLYRLNRGDIKLTFQLLLFDIFHTMNQILF